MVQLGNGLAGFWADLVLECEYSDDGVVAQEVEDCGSPCPPTIRCRCELVGLGDAALAQQGRSTDRVTLAVDCCFDAAPGGGTEAVCPGKRAAFGGAHDRSCQGMLGLHLDCWSS
jgi:hypothetical protein